MKYHEIASELIENINSNPKMSDTNSLRTTAPTGEVHHTNILSQDIGNLFSNEDYSDISLVVEQRIFPAHRVILAARCEYFRALLYGGMRESDPKVADIELKATPSQAFEALLKYIYTGKMSLTELKEDALLDILGLAHRYGFRELEDSISDYLHAILSIHNVCLIYNVATLYQLSALKETACIFMDRNASEVMMSETFLSLSKEALKDVISRDSFYAREIEIFKAVMEWKKANTDVDDKDVLKSIRLPLMEMSDLLNTVRPTGILSADAILDAIKIKEECSIMTLDHRGCLVQEQNIANAKYDAEVIKGEMKAHLLDGDHTNYDLDRGFTRHPIEDAKDVEKDGIIIKLGKPSLINTIKMLLWDRDMRSYSYKIEVSIDQKDWIQVIDHANHLCRSWQTLHFKSRVCKYVRVTGVKNTVNKVFHLVSFECWHTAKPFQLEDGLILPTENVATIPKSACVIEGVSRSRNALLNGDTKHYDWDSGYTCHQLGSGSIVVQLAQPYIIGSIRMLLWDCDDRTYSYHIEVSTDNQTWIRVADKTKENCRSWQTLYFPQRAVAFIKIVGTRNTANEVFHCVHVECPAQKEEIQSDGDSTSSGKLSPTALGAVGGSF